MAGSAGRRRVEPDPDVDSSTDEGAEIIKFTLSLYDKARDHQDQLTEAERQLFLNRGDVVAKALGSPDFLTTEEIHQACGWSPPDVVRPNIQHATGGRLSTPAELFRKVKDALENGQFDTAINDEAACLIVYSFYALEVSPPRRFEEPHGIPGLRIPLVEVRSLPSYDPPQPSAATLMAAQDQARRKRIARELSDSMASAEEQFRQGVISEQDLVRRVFSIKEDMMRNIDPSSLTRYRPEPPNNAPFQLISLGVPLPSLTDRVGSGLWPAAHGAVGGFDLFHPDTDFHRGDAANRAVLLWAARAEDQKDVYRARAEAKRREAWAEFEKNCPARTLNQPIGFWEVLARWEALTDEQRGLYEQRSRQVSRDKTRNVPFCVSEKYYTIETGDDCNSLAFANNVSSADVVDAAQAVGTVISGCSGLPCITISARAGIRDVKLYNRWLDPSCDNLHEPNTTLSHVVRISPVGGAYVPGTATSTSGIPHRGSVRTSPIAAAPPKKAPAHYNPNSTSVSPNTTRLSTSACTAEEGINMYGLCEHITLSVPF
ncbi:hypothetical protein N658DRAFT_521147 [Parathielavia hyrcaniae]|uniref:Uncharacterized protein n=1 Tax=Parathielavia hyrcaniae TaxID=113614 RepID=A0AAN6Q952_9PEZI|nr:hypothetical protein N658DRAFT_521147 [Parathielavia hyrcaniae]